MRPKPRCAALETMEREIVQTPLVLERQENLRHIYSNLVQVLESRDQLAEAEVACRRALDICRTTRGRCSRCCPTPHQLSSDDRPFGLFVSSRQGAARGRTVGARAIEIQNALAAARPDDVAVRQRAVPVPEQSRRHAQGRRSAHGSEANSSEPGCDASSRPP